MYGILWHCLINNNLFYHLIFTYKSFNVDPNSVNVSCRASGHFVCIRRELDGLNAIYNSLYTNFYLCTVLSGVISTAWAHILNVSIYLCSPVEFNPILYQNASMCFSDDDKWHNDEQIKMWYMSCNVFGVLVDEWFGARACQFKC